MVKFRTIVLNIRGWGHIIIKVFDSIKQKLEGLFSKNKRGITSKPIALLARAVPNSSIAQSPFQSDQMRKVLVSIQLQTSEKSDQEIGYDIITLKNECDCCDYLFSYIIHIPISPDCQLPPLYSLSLRRRGTLSQKSI